MLFSAKQQEQRKPFFRSELQPDGTLEVLIYDEIGENYWTGEGITDKQIKRQIDAAGSDCKTVLLCINSPGGDAFQGMGIYGVLKNCGKNVAVRIDGIAASAASIIAMAGDTIEMGPQALMMIHRAWGMTMGYASDMRNTANALDQISDGIGQAYVQKTKIPLNEIQAMMEAETWMGAKECLDRGFCTKVSDYEDKEAMNMAKNFKALAKMKKLPKSLRNANDPAAPDGTPCNCPCENCRAENCMDCSNSDCTDKQCEDCPMQASAKAKAEAKPHTKEKKNTSDGDCGCPCDACTAGNCDQCDNPECLDPDCTDCPMQGEASNRVKISPRIEVVTKPLNGAIASHSTGTTDEAWDASAQEKKLDSPMTTSTAKKMYAWMDSDKVEDGKITKSACKLPHHMVSADGTPGAANMKACSSAIGNLNGGRQKPAIPDSDRRATYNHLARHLKDGGQEAPPLKDEFTLEEEPKSETKVGSKTQVDEAEPQLQPQNFSILEAELELMQRRTRL